MRYTFAPIFFSAAVSAAVIERACTFTVTASGGASGTVGQLTDGQVRVGPALPTPTAQFSITNGQITDAAGRGCILTAPTSQFQCDVGATPSGGFSIGSNGVISSSGSSTFYACPATDNGDYNFYTTPVAGQLKCVEVTLTASGCYTSSTGSGSGTSSTPATAVAATPSATKSSNSGSGGSESSTATTLKTSTVTKTTTPVATQSSTGSGSGSGSSGSGTGSTTASSSSSSSCPANLSGAYQYPHLIIPVDSSAPTTAAGTSYNGLISSTVSSIFNFDIPTTYTGTCSLVFLFPVQAELETSSYTFSGPGSVDFSLLSSAATQSTTFDNQPSVKTDLGTFTVTPGSSTVVASFACPAGERVSYELKSVGGTQLEYFQDYNPSPIGLYVTAC